MERVRGEHRVPDVVEKGKEWRCGEEEERAPGMKEKIGEFAQSS